MVQSCGAGARRENNRTANEYGVSFEDEEKVLELDSGDQYRTLQIY